MLISPRNPNLIPRGAAEQYLLSKTKKWKFSRKPRNVKKVTFFEDIIGVNKMVWCTSALERELLGYSGISYSNFIKSYCVLKKFENFKVFEKNLVLKKFLVLKNSSGFEKILKIFKLFQNTITFYEIWSGDSWAKLTSLVRVWTVLKVRNFGTVFRLF